MNRPLPRPTQLALALLCTVVMLPTPALRAQDEPASQPAPAEAGGNDVPIVSASELKLDYFIAQHASVSDLQSAIQGLAARRFLVRNADGTLTGPVSNVRRFSGPTILVYDLPDRVAQVTEILANLDAMAGKADDAQDGLPAEKLELADYTPRNVSLDNLSESLQPFRHEVRDEDGAVVMNITFVEAPARIVLRDTAGNIERIQELLQRFDVPAPQLMLHCWLLRGADQGDGTDLPSDLTDNLRRLVPYRDFETASTAMLRVSIVGGQEQRLRGRFERFDEEQRFELSLVPAGYDAHSQTLTLRQCKFESTTGQEFSTAAVVKLDEYVVLGAAGSDPLFVVLRVTPIDR
jgi:hypothetical protein